MRASSSIAYVVPGQSDSSIALGMVGDPDLAYVLDAAVNTLVVASNAATASIYLEQDATWRRVAHAGADVSVGDVQALRQGTLGSCNVDSSRPCTSAVIPLDRQGKHVGAMFIAADGCELPATTLALAQMIAKQVSGALRLSARNRQNATVEQFQFALDLATDAVVILDPDGTLVDANRHALALVGATRDQVVGHHMHEFAAAGDEAKMDRGMSAKPEPMTLRRLDGDLRHVEGMRIPISVRGEQRQLIIARDVSDRFVMEERLRSSEERYRTLVENMPDFVWLGTATRTYTVSDNVERVLGVSPQDMLAGTLTTCAGRVHPDDVSRVEQAMNTFLAKGQPLDVCYRFMHPERGWLWLHARGIRAYELEGAKIACVIVADITQRHQLEEQLLHAQKMEAIGMLSGGIAHDFNNILSVVLSNCDFLAEALAELDPRHADVLEIRKAGERGASLTRQLLAFSRRQVLEPTILDLNQILRDLQKMLRRLIGEDIKLSVHPGANLGSVRADAGQIEQVIMNIVVNARDAMTSGGAITIDTANVELDDAYATSHPPLAAGSYVQLSISDNGCGIDDATKRRIFEPFFSTKGVKGTGLGLSTTYGIVKQSGGSIWVYSEVGKGTTFNVYLPRIDVVAVEPGVSAPFATTVAGYETILLLEDDDGVRRGVTRALKGRGYNVLQARNGQEASALFAAHAPEIDIVLSDVVMPGGNGLQIVEQLRASYPDLKALFMSGYTEHAALANGMLPEGVSFIHKPFSTTALCRRVRDVLDS
jgi:PAS domain S-box-containing protein